MRKGLVAAALLGARVASAQLSGDAAALRADLLGPDGDRAVAAASALGALAGNPEATRALMSALELGTVPARSVAILDALGQHASVESFDLLRHFAGHRRRELRLAAIDALARLRDARTSAVLIDGLRDGDPTVRARAARLLGERKEKAAEAALFKVLVRGDESAAEPLGGVAGIETAEKLLEMVGRVSDRALATVLGALLVRADFGPDPLRDQVVKTLGNLPGDQAVLALEAYDRSLPPAEERPSRTEARRILEGRGRQPEPAPDAPAPAPGSAP